jgi:hypothetical protein
LKGRLEPVRKNFGNDLIRDIAKTDRFEMVHRMWSTLLWNQGDKGMVLHFSQILMKKEVPNILQHFTLNYMPIFFVE